jgi:hypothetical protein
MGKIIISDNVSLDGVIQDPAGDEGFRLGGWAGRPAAREETAQVLLDEALGTQALLFGVSRSWIYTQPALRDQIEQLRYDPPRPRRSGSQAGGSRASAESLRRRRALAHQQIQQLRSENQQLRQSLACAHGQLRAASSRAQAARDDRT